jgi:glycosyltransferase involved in cell wall biosynthesis
MRPRTRILYYRFDPGIVGVVLLARIIGYRPAGEMNNLMFGTDYPDRVGGARESLLDSARVMTLKVARRVTRDFVAVTDRIKEIMVSGYGVPADRVHVLPNGVDTERFRPQDRSAARERLGLDASCRYVVFVGLMASWVDFRTMLEAFAGASETRPDARFVLVGDGPEARLVDSLIDDLDLADRVIRPGSIADRDLVSAYMGAASVCLVAYHGAMLQRIGGGSPMKLMEYLAAGRAVVATATEGMASMINSSGGGLAVGDAEAMAAALGELLDDQERADELGRRGRRAAVEHYSWKPVIERTLALLDRPS